MSWRHLLRHSFAGCLLSSNLAIPCAAEPLFTSALHFRTASNPNALVQADFDSDGRLDVAAVTESDSLTILRGNGDGSFERRADYRVGRFPRSIAAGDFDLDGHVDLAISSLHAYGATTILLGHGDCTFHFSRNVETGPYSYSSIAVADLNRDGRLDLIAANTTYDGSVSVLRGEGGATFRMRTAYPAGGNPGALAVADFNRDGNLDVAVLSSFPAGWDDGTFAVLPGNGDGSLGPPVRFLTCRIPGSMKIDDMNGDGLLDVVIGGESQVRVHLGDGNGGFGAGGVLEGRTSSLALGDLNGDRRPDIAFSTTTEDLVTVLQNATGDFGPQYEAHAGLLPTSIVIADANSDGRQDLLVANFASHTVSVLLGNDDGTVLSRTELPLGDPRSIAMADVNADGRMDLLAGKAGYVSLWLGTPEGTLVRGPNVDTAPYPVALAVEDFNHDGIVDIAVASLVDDLVAIHLGIGRGYFESRWLNLYPTGDNLSCMVVADFNSDGHVDVAAGSGSHVSMLLGNGDGTLQPRREFPLGGLPYRIAAGDVNADGHLDVAVTDHYNSRVSVLLGNGDGTFQPRIDLPAGDTPWGLAIADLNGDGRDDIAATGEPGRLFLSRPDGGFDAVGLGPRRGIALGVADVTGDGAPDVLLTYWGLSVLPGNGAGAFAAPLEFDSGPGRDMIVGDLNGDSSLDVVLTGFVVSILYGRGSLTTPISVEGFLATAEEDFVHLTWMLAGERSEYSGVDVQRSEAPEGPYEVRVTGLEPQPFMEYRDRMDPARPWYRLVVHRSDGAEMIVGPIRADETLVPSLPVLMQPYLLPHDDVVLFRYLNPVGGAPFGLSVHDARGRALWSLTGQALRGENRITWNRRDGTSGRVARGIYFARLRAPGFSAARKFVLSQ